MMLVLKELGIETIGERARLLNEIKILIKHHTTIPQLNRIHILTRAVRQRLMD